MYVHQMLLAPVAPLLDGLKDDFKCCHGSYKVSNLFVTLFPDFAAATECIAKKIATSLETLKDFAVRELTALKEV